MRCLALQERPLILSCSLQESSALSLMRTPPVDWKEEDLVFFGTGGLVNSGGQLIRRGEEDMVLLARTSITSAVPLSLFLGKNGAETIQLY